MLLVLLALLAPPDAGLVEVVAPASSPGEGLPLVCGLLDPSALGGRDDELAALATSSGDRVPVVLHARGSRRLLHGVLPAGTGGGVLRPTRRVPRAGAFPTVGLRGGPPIFEIATGALDLQVGPGAELRSEDLHVALVPDVDVPGTWSIDHACAVRVDLVFTGRPSGAAGAGALEIRFLVSAFAGLDRIELGVHVLARAGTDLPHGVALRAEGTSAVAVAFREGRVPANDGPAVEGRWLAGTWHEGDRVLGRGERGVLVLEGNRTNAFRFGGGFAEGGESFLLGPGGGFAELRWIDPGTRLREGEGRLLRAVLGGGNEPPAPAPLVLPRRRPSGMIPAPRGRTPASPDCDDPLAGAVASLLESFRTDPRHGLLLEGPGAGDWMIDAENAGNLEYDTVLGLLGWAFERRDAAAWALAQAAADHALGADRDAAGSGLFFHHGITHRSGKVEIGHHWVDGQLLLDRWTADPLRGPVVEEVLAATLQRLSAADLEREYPRSLGWGLWALAAGASSGSRDPGWKKEIRRWRRHVLGRATRSGLLQVTRGALEDGLHFENPFVQGGIVAPGLLRTLDALPSSADRAQLDRLVRSLSRNAVVRREEGWFLAERILLDPATGKVAGRSGRAPGEETALFLSGLLQVEPGLGRDPRLQRLRSEVEGRLTAHRRRTYGRELSMLLRAVPALRDR